MALVAKTRPKSWSELFTEVTQVISSPDAPKLILRLLDETLLDTLAKPLSELPKIDAENVPNLDEEKSRFAEQFALACGKEGNNADAQRVAMAFYVTAGEHHDKDLLQFLSSIYGSSGHLAAGKPSKAGFALSKLFCERRALLLTLERIMSDLRLVEVRKKLVDLRLVQNMTRQVTWTSLRLRDLISSSDKRVSLRLELQVATLIWERTMLLRIAFLSTISNALRREAVEELMRVYGEICEERLQTSQSIVPSMSGSSNVSSIMTSPTERVQEWALLEKSHAIDCLLYALAACISSTNVSSAECWTDSKLGSSSQAGAQWNDDDDYWSQEQPSWILDLIGASRMPANSENRSIKFQHVAKKRTAKFIRCLLRSGEFRGARADLRNFLSRAIWQLLVEMIKWRTPNDFTNGRFPIRTGNFLGSYPEDDDSEDEGQNNYGQLAVPECESTNYWDSMDDLVECIISLMRNTESQAANAIRFFTSNDPCNNFLCYYEQVNQDKYRLFNLLSALAAAGEAHEMFAHVRSFLSDGFVADTAVLLQQYREGLVYDARVEELRSRLKALGCLASIADEDGIALIGNLLVARFDFAQNALSVIAHPAITHYSLKTSLIDTLANFAASYPNAVADYLKENWRRFFILPWDNVAPSTDPRFDLRAHLNQIESSAHSYGLTIAVLRLTQALVNLDNASKDLSPLLRFVMEDVFFRYDERIYTCPGERWTVCLESLRVFLIAVEAGMDGPGVGYATMDCFLRESLLFAKLVGILSSVGGGKAAVGLEDALIVLRRVPGIEGGRGRSLFDRPNWVLVMKKPEGLESGPNQTSSTNLGPLLHQVKGGNQEVIPKKTDYASRKIVEDWLALSDPLPTEEHAFLWDDGDPLSHNRLLCAKTVLEFLQALMGAQDKFLSWNRSISSLSLPLRVESLILSQSQFFVRIISSYIGFKDDSECRTLALDLIDRVAMVSLSKEEQVFAWISSSSFTSSLNLAQTTDDRQNVFDFLCKHLPTKILRELAPTLVRIANAPSDDYRLTANATRTLSIICLDERRRSTQSNTGGLISSNLIEKIVRHHLSAVGSDLKKDPFGEIISSLSWVLRLAIASNADVGFLFEGSRSRPSLHESILRVLLRGMKIGGEHVAQALQSWRAVLERGLSTSIASPILLLLDICQALSDFVKALPTVQMEMAKTMIVLVRLIFEEPAFLYPALSSREEMFALLSGIITSAITMFAYGNQEALAIICSSLLFVISEGRAFKHKALNNSSLSKEEISMMEQAFSDAINEAFGSEERAERLMDASLSVLSDLSISQHVKSVGAATLAMINSFAAHMEQWADSVSQRGVLQNLVSVTSNVLSSPIQDVDQAIKFLQQNADNALIPTLEALQELALSSPKASAVIADSLATLWQRPSPLLGSASSPVRTVAVQNPFFANARSRLVVMLMRLVLVLSQTDVRFAIRFMRLHRDGIVATVAVMASESDLDEAFYIVSILTTCFSAPEIVASESNDGKDLAEFNECVGVAFAKAAGRLRTTPPALLAIQRKRESRLVRSCLLCMCRQVVASGLALSTERRRDEIESLISVVLFYLEAEVFPRDVEKCLVVLLDRLSRGWNSSDDMGFLRALFPKLLAGATSPSTLERFIETDKGFIGMISNKIAELRFR